MKESKLCVASRNLVYTTNLLAYTCTLFKWFAAPWHGKINKAENTIEEDSKRGCILEVSLECPEELIDLHMNIHLHQKQIRLEKACCRSVIKRYQNKIIFQMVRLKKLYQTWTIKKNMISIIKTSTYFYGLKWNRQILTVLKSKRFQWLKLNIDFISEKRKNAVSKI